MKRISIIFGLLLSSLYTFTANAQFLSLSWPLDRSIIQHSGGYGSVYVAGQLVGCPDAYDKLQMRIEQLDKYGSYSSLIQDYTDITRDNGGMGLYREEAYLAKGWYHILVKAVNSGGGLVAINDVKVGVGNVFIVAGQSNAQSIVSSGGTNASLPSDSPYDCVVSNNWIGDCDWVTSSSPNYVPYPIFPVFQKLSAGNHIAPNGYNSWAYIRLGNLQVDNAGAPTAFFNVASPTTDIAAWKTSADGNSVSGMPYIGYPCSSVGVPSNSGLPYKKLQQALNYYGSLFGARGVLWHQGEAESEQSYATSGSYNSDYYNKLNGIISKSRSDYGYTVPWFVSNPATYISKYVSGSWLYGIVNSTVQSDQASVAASTGSGASTDSYNYQYRHPGDYIHLNENSSSYQGLTALANSWQSNIGTSGSGIAAQTLPSITLSYNSGTGVFTAYAPSGYSDYKWVNGNGDLDRGVGSGSSASSMTLAGAGVRCWVKNSSGNWSLTPIVYAQSCTSGARKAAFETDGTNEFGYKLTVYPNPSIQTTTISFKLPFSAMVELELLDSQGNLKQSIVKARHDQGTYSYSVNLTALPSGMYLCRLKAGDVAITKKVIIEGK